MLPERMWHLPTRQWVTVLGDREGWVAVRYPDGSIGTVPVGTLAAEES